MSRTRVDREAIESLVKILDEKGLTKIEYEVEGLRISVARAGSPAAAPVAMQAGAAHSTSEATPAPEEDAGKVVESPMVGTVFLAASPESPPFVEVGDRVKKGQVVCIIEAMKLMNEIECEHDGVIAERLVDNGQGVGFGQPLFRITTA